MIFHSPNVALIPTPVENMVYANQQAYYDAIQGEALDDGTNVSINVGENERKILSIIAHTPGR